MYNRRMLKTEQGFEGVYKGWWDDGAENRF